MPNQLSGSTSPYLLQHADNPIDWWPWCAEAFAEARRRNVPVLLSVGYASCHWCHVMAHESFADVGIAQLVNTGFVAIKVDREERPDIDAVYLAATKAMTGSGGWPMTCFLTPEGEPFQCGAYYPPQPRPGTPSFRQLLDAVVAAWRNKGDQVRAKAAQLTATLARQSPSMPSPWDGETLDSAAAALAADFDPEHGGFAGAPKFPSALSLEFLVRHHERTGSARALEIVEVSCERMARGALFDQLAGGFARYTVDVAWAAPHFEKTLPDNALLLRLYARLARRTGSPLARRVAADTAAFLLDDLRTAAGVFASALDADSDGVEGLTYLWDHTQLRDVLGEGDAHWAAELLDLTGSAAPRFPAEPDDPVRWHRIREALRAARRDRPQPARDDKAVTGWNGLAITALAEAGAAWGRADWVDAASAAATHILDRHLIDGRLRRSSRDGVAAAAAAVLEDHGCLAEGLLTLYQVTGRPHWLSAALDLLETALARFRSVDGTWYDTADDAEQLLRRPRDRTDGATPSGAAAVAGALLTASVLAPPSSSARYADAAADALAGSVAGAARQPRFGGWWLAVAEAALRGPLQVAVVGDPASRAPLEISARMSAPGGTLVLGSLPGGPDGRPLVNGLPAAYVCRGSVCDRPVVTPAELARALS
jgi:uncharacterized protein